jgi:hypothetical protein
MEDDVKVRFDLVFENTGLVALLSCNGVGGTFGSRKSSGGVVCKYLLGASCRKARAAEEGLECVSCEQLLLIHRVAMFLEGESVRVGVSRALRDIRLMALEKGVWWICALPESLNTPPFDLLLAIL